MYKKTCFCKNWIHLMRIAKCKICNVWWTSINRCIEERVQHNEQFVWVSLGLGIPLIVAETQSRMREQTLYLSEKGWPEYQKICSQARGLAQRGLRDLWTGPQISGVLSAPNGTMANLPWRTPICKRRRTPYPPPHTHTHVFMGIWILKRTSNFPSI